MKAILEVLKIDINDIITTSTACSEDAGGTETGCGGDDEC